MKKPAPAQFSTAVQPADTEFSQTDFETSVLEGDIPGLVRAFSQWRKDMPDLRNVARGVVARFGFHENQRMEAILHAAIDLAAEPNGNAFHNNRHFLEVFSLAATLGQRAFEWDDLITHNQLGLLLTAALIHDYKHDGTHNKGIQYRLEKLAMDSAEPALKAAGATPEELQILRALAYTTDVSKDFSNLWAKSPAESVKAYSVSKNPDDLFDELKLLHDLGLADVALMLEDSDLGPSLISTALCKQGSEYLGIEQGKPQDSVFFLNKISHGRAYSQAGYALIQPHLNQVMKDFRVTGKSLKAEPQL